MRFSAVFNQDGGTFRTLDMAEFCAEARRIFVAAGHEFECRCVTGDQLEAALAEVAGAGEESVLLAGGGDGTISAAAAVAFSHGVPLAVLPAGTMNLFARTLGLPLDLNAALEALAGGAIGAADIASADGRPFVHQFSVGIHARLVRIREGLAYRSRLGKMLASSRAIVAAVARPPLFEVEIRAGGRSQTRRASAVTVTNNLFEEGHIPHAEAFDAGMLGVYTAGPMTSWGMARLCLSVLRGRWKQHPQVSEEAVSAVTLRFPRRKHSAQAVIDGELVRLPQEVVLRSHPAGLRVVLPRAGAQAAA
jgi:diacylglycerol kinase family enzyme